MITALKETGAVSAMGVSLKEVEAINLRLKSITASGTGTSVKKSKFAGDIELAREFRDLRERFDEMDERATDVSVGVAPKNVHFTVYYPSWSPIFKVRLAPGFGR